MSQRSLGISVLCGLFGAGCSAGGSTLDVGREGTGGKPGGALGTGGNIVIGGLDSGIAKALSVHVEHDGLRVEFVTLACSGECADVLAVAKGGNAPYTYTWEDGSRDAARRVCPTATTRYEVTATDSGISSPEFHEDPKTVRASLTANVLECPLDGGAPTKDSGPPPPPPPTGQLCVSNASLEGTPGVGEVVGLQGDAWFNCNFSGSPDYWDEKQAATGHPQNGLPASDGSTYMALYCSGADCSLFGVPAQDSIGEAACAPLVAGTRYSFQIDLAYRSDGSGTPGGVEIWGGTARCGTEQLLWTSPQVTSDWKTYCGSFVAKQDLAFIQVRAARGYAGSSGAFVDHVVPVASCAP